VIDDICFEHGDGGDTDELKKDAHMVAICCCCMEHFGMCMAGNLLQATEKMAKEMCIHKLD
jgi:hypothetical protein